MHKVAMPIAYDRRALADLTYLGGRVSNLSAVVRSQLVHDTRRWDIELKLELEKMVEIYHRFWPQEPAPMQDVPSETEENLHA